MTNKEYGDQPINVTTEDINHGDGIVQTKTEYYGMTLRQYYAGLAMQGFVTRGNTTNAEDTAFFAVNCADTLIKELNRNGD